MAHDVFISYSHKDKLVADGICTNLEGAGIRCWIAPRDVAPGEDWPTAITKAIENSRILLLVFSANSNSSDDVSRELILAANSKLVIIPFKIENIEPEAGKRYYLARTHWLDAVNPPTKEQITKLVSRVKAILPATDSASPNEKKVNLTPSKEEDHSLIQKRNDPYSIQQKNEIPPGFPAEGIIGKEPSIESKNRLKKSEKTKRTKINLKILLWSIALIGVLTVIVLCVLSVLLWGKDIQTVFFPTKQILTTKTPTNFFTQAPFGGAAYLLFESERSGNEDIYIMKTDGSDVRNLTNNPAFDAAPAWSPDYTKIAFVSDRDGDGNEIFIMNPDGSGLIKLTDNNYMDTLPSWSPDGKNIAFVSSRDGIYNIYIMDIQTKAIRSITNDSHWNYLPTWSPDGTKIAFDSRRNGVDGIYVIDVISGKATNLTNDLHGSSPAWSPDGSKIAFTSTRDGNWEIYLMNSDGSSPIRLTNNSESDRAPSWSPDGSMISFVSNRDGDEEIFIMTASGEGITQLTYNEMGDNLPCWSRR